MMKFKTAVVGCGAIAPLHIDALKDVSRITALCDIDISKAEALKERFGLDCNIYSEFSDMLEGEELDALHICTPHYLHTKMAAAALKRGIHVLCEKPMCINEEELFELEAAIKESSAMFGVCFQHRYDKSFNTALRHTEKDPPIGGEGRVFWRRTEDYYKGSPWRGRIATEGGSLLINQAIHTLDLLSLIFGGIDSVCAISANLRHKEYNDTEDTLAAFCKGRFANFNFFATNNAQVSAPAEIKIFTKNGVLEFTDRAIRMNGVPIDSEVSENKSIGKELWGCSHEALINDFYRCLRSGDKFPVDFYSVRELHRAVFAIYRSGGENIPL